MTRVKAADDTPIWRYMDLARFTSLAFSRRLWFTKLGELWRVDPWEGFARARGLRRPSRDLLKGAQITLNVAHVLYSELSGVAAETIRNARHHVFANSWCVGGESLGMWERYGAAGGGVAIESTVGRFRTALKREVRAEQYAFGVVEYHGGLNMRGILRHDFTKGPVPASAKLWKLALSVGFQKRSFFEDEREWRAAIFQERRTKAAGLLLATSLEVLIKSVRLGPRADRPTVDAVSAVMNCAGLTCPLETSGILLPPRVRRSF